MTKLHNMNKMPYLPSLMMQQFTMFAIPLIWIILNRIVNKKTCWQVIISNQWLKHRPMFAEKNIFNAFVHILGKIIFCQSTWAMKVELPAEIANITK